MSIKAKDKLLEFLGLTVAALGIMIGNSETSDAQELYYGGNHGGNISNPPEGSVVSIELSEQYGYPVSIDETNGTYYMYVTSHWFDPQQMTQFPSDVWMYGIAPYDHHPNAGGGINIGVSGAE